MRIGGHKIPTCWANSGDCALHHWLHRWPDKDIDNGWNPCLHSRAGSLLRLCFSCGGPCFFPAIHCPAKEWTESCELQDEAVLRMLASFRWIRCSFTYYSNPSMHYLQSLRNLVAKPPLRNDYLQISVSTTCC